MALGLIYAAMAGAQAASAAPLPQPVDDIVITGERGRRTVRDTASSVTVFTAEDIAAEPGADRLDQLLEQTPNVTLGTTSLGPTIRGQNTTGVLQDLPAFLGGTRPRVTLQVDGRGVSYNEFVTGTAPLWDVAQVEIFRSPQTTTQGRNSIAGAIFIETEDPSYTPVAAARGIVGDIAMHQVSAMVSAPVIDNQFAFRLAGDLRHGRPASELTDRMEGADPNNDDYGLLRFKLLAEPSAVPGLRVETSVVHSRAKMPQVEGVRAPFEERRDPTPGYGVFETTVTSATMRAEAELASRLSGRATIAIGDSRAQRFPPPGLGEAVNETADWSAEGVLVWRPNAALELLGGAHHLRSNLEQSIDLTAVIGLGEFRDRQQSTAIFGEAVFRPLTRLRVTAGARYQSDSQRRTGEIGNPQFRLPLDYDETFDAFLPKVSAAYDFSNALTAGLVVQRAYNPGGTTLNFDTGDHETFAPEYAWSYELFARASLGRARLSANLFQTDFRDAQRAQTRAYSVPGGSTAFWAEIENVPRSRSRGAEASLDWRLSHRLRVGAGVGLLRTRITRTIDPNSPISGKEFQRAPHFTASGSVSWQPADQLTISASVRHHSDYFSSDNNSEALLIEGNTIANARAAWTFGRTTLFGYARNLFDTFYMTHLSSLNAGTAVDPRELGVGLETRF